MQRALFYMALAAGALQMPTADAQDSVERRFWPETIGG
jgi:hypothetical protein